MKKIILIILVVVIILIIGVYFIISNSNNKLNNKDNDYNKKEIKDNKNTNEFTSELNIVINGKNYNLILEDNATTRELFKNLPVNFEMEELNGNEKYIYLDKTYPTDSVNIKHVNKGDVMLYEDNCLVIFYKNFDTSYSYTKLGHIDNLEELDNKNVNVEFKKK